MTEVTNIDAIEVVYTKGNKKYNVYSFKPEYQQELANATNAITNLNANSRDNQVNVGSSISDITSPNSLYLLPALNS